MVARSVRPLACAGLLLLITAARVSAQTVITPMPDPTHPILSQGFQDQIDQDCDSRLTDGNAFELLENGIHAFPRMLDLMASAQQHLYCTSMLANYDRAGKQFADGLIAAAGRGVRVQCIFDGMTSDPRLVARLRHGGVEVALFNPWFDFGGRRGRQHQKLLIADGRVVITGGMNIGTAYLEGTGRDRYYHDTAVRVEGPAAAEAAVRFLELWTELRPNDAASQALLSNAGAWRQPGPVTAGQDGRARHIQQESDVGEEHIARFYKSCFDSARHQIVWHVNNVRPSGETFEGLRDAAARGVRVVIVTNSRAAFQRRNGILGWFQHWTLQLVYLPRLAGTGVEVWLSDYPIHSKALTIDGVMASIGSYNFSDHSDKNLEGTMVIFDPALVHEVEEMFERDLAGATRFQ